MGCLPLIVALLAGTGIGYLVAGPAGALWGFGCGLLAGILAAAAFAAFLRRSKRN